MKTRERVLLAEPDWARGQTLLIEWSKKTHFTKIRAIDMQNLKEFKKIRGVAPLKQHDKGVALVLHLAEEAVFK